MSVQVMFLENDRYGLWKKGDLASDLGPESDHPDAPNIRIIVLERDGQTLSLESPYERGLIEKVPR